MKTLPIQIVAVLVALAAEATDAHGQLPARVTRMRPLYSVDTSYSYRLRPSYYVPRLGYYWHGGATAAGSYARGIAAMTHAQGVYNRLTAEARVIHAEARSREIENHEMAAETYFAMRQANRQAHSAARRPRLSSEEMARLAELANPDRLTEGQQNSTTGEVSWPILLQADEFAAFRRELENTLAQRVADQGLAPEEQLKAQQTIQAMLEELKRLVREVNPTDYVEARRFIKSLAYETRLPLI